MTLKRRELFRLGFGGAFGAMAALLGREAVAGTHEARELASGARGDPNAPTTYQDGIEPPATLGPTALDALLRPPPFVPGPRGRRHEVSVQADERPLEIARGVRFNAWTYNGSVPGPVLRATEGDELLVRFRNLGLGPHNLHFHGRHGAGEDGWEPVPAGGETTYRLRAGPVGLHPYHCHALPLSEHIGRGLYGTLIVDPPGGRPPAHEFVLVLCGFDADGDGANELYGWNGVAGFFARYPIKVPAGKLVRLYLVNMVSIDPIASFHLHAEPFDVFRGSSLEADERTDVITLGQTERAIVEFRLPERGRYMFHPHQARMAEGGAMGWLAAV